ncbi:MAG: CoA-binding protein [Phycisphaerales bacterium]|nr:CoA-binding protein [Phycisphaerales bacterium]
MSLDLFFDPKSVAVVGASRQKGKVGHEVVAGLLAGEFEGDIFPVNPNADEVEGLTCHPTLKDIGTTPDLVVIVVPAKLVPDVMNECSKLRVKAVIIITAGFKEIGDEGKRLEEQIVRIATRSGIQVVGPNCLGIMVPDKKLNASFGGDLPATGAVGYVSQSGALMTAILDMARANDIGFSKMVSIGNKSDVDELDVMVAFGADDNTKVIAGYLESITDGDRFVRQMEMISQDKPVLLIKSGGTGAGAKAASSHTGSLAGNETAYEVIFDRAGIIRCPSVRTQFDYAQAFVHQPLPPGDRVAVITNAGGPGIMTADAIERKGLTFAELSEDTIAKLTEALPAAANVQNPIDVLGDALPDRYEVAMDVVLADPGVDSVIVVLTPQAMTDCDETARAILRAAEKAPGKTILASFLGGAKIDDAIGLLRRGGVPQYDSPESAVTTLRVMNDYVAWRQRPKRVVKLFPVNRRKVEQIVERHIRRNVREIGERESKEMLEAYGFATPKDMIATSVDQAANIAEQLGYPLVMKIWSPDIIHKSDIGGVRVGLNNSQQVVDAYELMMHRVSKKMPDAEIHGVLLQEMCKDGMEVILGMHRDPNFGPMLMFGMGGVTVEVLKDVSFCLAPVTSQEAYDMLARTKAYQLLEGVRGREGVDIGAIAEGIQRLSQLVTAFPDIQEMDINPFVVGPEGTIPVAVDARISVEKK